jgi:alpha-galactosidase
MLLAERSSLKIHLAGETPQVLPVSGLGPIRHGPVEIDVTAVDPTIAWSVANAGDEPVQIEAVSFVSHLATAGEPVRVFLNGYQSWSRAGVVVLGETDDPSRHPSSIELARGIFHADQQPAAAGELRSEMVTVIDPGAGDGLLCCGFGSALTDHDGTFRIRRFDEGLEVEAQAFLGGAVIEPGESRSLHQIEVSRGPSVAALLSGWASGVGAAGGARVDAPYQLGWCSWYQYFHALDEKAVKRNLALSERWPFEVFQIDDGYQTAVGDWLDTNEKFSSDLSDLAGAISSAGKRPGIWLAPFLAAPGSGFGGALSEMLARAPDGKGPLVGAVNEGWGGQVFVLDTTRTETLSHLEELARALVEAGFRYLKLDFVYAPSLPGRYMDSSRTPAQRVRAGLEAIRKGAGHDTFLLGCGCPLGPAIGIVDGMRIGPDVAPYWDPEPVLFLGYEDEAPATVNAWRNTIARSFMHRRLWLNDPDCIMLRTTQTRLPPQAARAWALVAAASGGMAMVSDDLSLLDREALTVLDEVVEIGKAVDDAARAGNPPVCEDLMESEIPGRLASPTIRLEGDPHAKTARVERIGKGP